MYPPRRLVARPFGTGLAVAAAALVIAACGSGSTKSGSSTGTSTPVASASGASGSNGASTGASSSTTPPAGHVSGHKKVVLVTCEPNVFCHAYNVNLTKILQTAGVSVTQLSDNFDPTLQSQHMAQAIAQKPDAIILFASNAQAIVPELQRAAQAGIPVINVNAPLSAQGEKYVKFEVVADNAALGLAAGENIVQGLQKAGYSKGNIIMITGTMGTQIVQLRIDAFKQYLAKYPQYKVVSMQDGNWDQVKSSQLALQLLTKYQSQGGIQGAYGMADYQAAGVIQAAQQLNIPTGVAHGDLVVTASNCTPTGYAQMQAGKLWGNATQSPIYESDTASKHIIAFLNGEQQPHTISVQEQRFTLGNYQSFVTECSHWPS